MIIAISAAAIMVSGSLAVTVNLYLSRKRNDEMEAENKGREKNNHEDQAIDDVVDSLTKLTEVTNTLTTKVKQAALTDLETVNKLLEDIEDGLQLIDAEIEKRSEFYAPLAKAGNLKIKEDGTYEIINLPGLNEMREKRATKSIENHNRYLRRSHGKINKIQSLESVLKLRKEELEAVSTKRKEELLEEYDLPEAELRDFLLEAQDSFEPILREIEESIEEHRKSLEKKNQQESSENSLGTTASPITSNGNPESKSPTNQPEPREDHASQPELREDQGDTGGSASGEEDEEPEPEVDDHPFSIANKIARASSLRKVNSLAENLRDLTSNRNLNHQKNTSEDDLEK